MTNGEQLIGCEIAAFHSGKRKDQASCPNGGSIYCNFHEEDICSDPIATPYHIVSRDE